jgi:hypothetical protein
VPHPPQLHKVTSLRSHSAKISYLAARRSSGVPALALVIRKIVAGGSQTYQAVTLPLGQLPKRRAKSGRHLVYTVGQTTSIDTYYSCSDVVFADAAAAVRAGTGGPTPTASAAPVASAADPTTRPVAATRRVGNPALPLAALTGAVVLIGGTLLLLLRRRRAPARRRGRDVRPPGY